MQHEGAHILVVDDDRRLRELLQRYLQDRGFIVTTVPNAPEARKSLDENVYELIILDIMMPGETGFEFLEKLRNDVFNPTCQIPVLILTAKGGTEDRIKGLELGADDYLPKPFDPKELFLRILTILRRWNVQQVVQKKIALGKFNFDVEKGMLFRAKQPVPLSTVESNLLKILAMNIGRTLSRDDLAKRGGVALNPRTIDVQITRLRRKIEVNPKEPAYIQTVRHKGYVLWAD
jgi:two-component system phosphate regulon response regulator OmpR